MKHCITVLPAQRNIEAQDGACLMDVLREAGFAPDAPCGGCGRCGKCRVLTDGGAVLACRTAVDRDMVVTISVSAEEPVLKAGGDANAEVLPGGEGYLLALDVGTTTVVGYLLTGDTGREVACASARNPQAAFGGDVISRIRHALKGQLEALGASVRGCAEGLTRTLCGSCGISPEEIRTVSLVGNPAMQQLFLGIAPENLARIPFAPVLTEAKTVQGREYVALWENAQLQIVPDISGFVGADTVACILASGMDRREELSLLVDIGTNGEMVMGSRERLVACSAAAGPALEGANIRFGMRAAAGAIDHVRWENRRLRCSVIGDGEPVGICGSGLIDAVAAALEGGMLSRRGKILRQEGVIPLTDRVWLTQEDIRQVQLAKGAIAAGIELMAARLGVERKDIAQVYLAGAFGTCMEPVSACRIGLLPPELAGRIVQLGNGAGSGAKMLARDRGLLLRAGNLAGAVESMELGAQPAFSRSFARNMRF